MKILFSLSYNPILNVTTGRHDDHEIVAAPRASDWGISGLRKYGHYIREAVRLMRRARDFDALVLCNVGIEAFVVGGWSRLLCPRTKVICLDLLMPRESRLVRAVRSWIKGIDAFVCIRSGDIPVLERRFGVLPSVCSFVHLPSNPAMAQTETSEGDYIYSSGFAHRDWPTLVAALSQIRHRAILSTTAALEIPVEAREWITVLPLQSPAEGRKLMANAKIVVLSLEDTDLPSGPLILLDAMAAGKPIVATNVNGTRDYVEDGRTALLVPPKDSDALAGAVRCLIQDEAKRLQLGRAALLEIQNSCTLKNLMDHMIRVSSTCDSHL